MRKTNHLPGLNFVVSMVLLGVLFGAIYKVLPDRSLQWNDVIVGAVITSVLFNIGKSLIAWYIGSSAIASTYSCCRRPHCTAVVGLLLGSDILVRG